MTKEQLNEIILAAKLTKERDSTITASVEELIIHYTLEYARRNISGVQANKVQLYCYCEADNG